VPIAKLARLATACGLDLSLKLYPAGQPIRDRAHIALFERLRRAAGPAWTWRSEVPLPIPGDKRAWDRVMVGGGITIGVEAFPISGAVALKAFATGRDPGGDALILI
jgi:hypothetical protein